MMPCSCAASSASAICLRDRQRFVDRDGPTRDTLREIVALDEFHHQRADASAVFQAIDVRDVRMVERGEDLRFALEPGEAIGIVGEGIRQHLHRDVAIELGVARAIHLAHAAFADLRGDLIRAKASAWS